jgi:dihydroxyacid dehydratase/phosphogluconate dehydratase
MVPALRRAHERHRVRHRGAACVAEAAAGGPLALVRDGDRIELDTKGRKLNLKVDDAELSKRQGRSGSRRRSPSAAISGVR